MGKPAGKRIDGERSEKRETFLARRQKIPRERREGGTNISDEVVKKRIRQGESAEEQGGRRTPPLGKISAKRSEKKASIGLGEER